MTDPERADSNFTNKRRSVPAPDLKIIVGSEGNQHIFHHHALFLAIHSDYIDAMLANEWTESDSRELTFPDIEPAVWNKMVGFLQDPVRCRQMKLKHALQVFPFYDKYQFPKGIQLCDRLFYDYAAMLAPSSFTKGDTLIEVALFAGGIIDGIAKEECLKCLEVRLSKLMFTEQQIQKLAPLIVKEDMLLEAIGVTKEEFVSPLFSQYWQARQLIRGVESDIRFKVKTQGTLLALCRCAGFRSYRGDATWNSKTVCLYVELSEASEWTIGSTHQAFGAPVGPKTLRWVNRHRNCLDVPPRTGWEAVHESANGVEVTITYGAK